MRVGLALDFGRHGGRLDRLVSDYEPILAAASAHSIHSVWAGEAFVAQGRVSGHVASPLLVLAGIAEKTSLALGVGVTLLPSWHPVRLAYDCAILDQLSSGRLILGVGIGRPPLWTQFGVSPDDVGDYADELLEACQALWSGAPGYQGAHMDIPSGIDPMPIQTGGPPIWVGGKASGALRRAARYGSAYLAGSSTGLGELTRLIPRLRKAQHREGDRPLLLAVNRIALVAPTEVEAKRFSHAHLVGWWRSYHERGLTDASFDEAVADMMLIGTPDSVTTQLAPYADLGFDHVNLRIAPIGLPLGIAEQTLNSVGALLSEGRWQVR